MMDFEAPRFSDAELIDEFDRLFPNGFAGPDVVEQLAPQGWHNSTLLAVYHPTLEQVFHEAVRIHRNIIALRRPDDRSAERPEPTKEIAREFREQPINVDQEVRELVAQCLWDVFSDNHEVVAADGRVLDLGSFRASGGFLADLLNHQSATGQYDYMSVYMGTIWVAQRADLTPVYRMIFRRLKQREHDWIYHFPRLYAVDFRPLRDLSEKTGEPEWQNYDPSKAFSREQEREAQDSKLVELRESLDEACREAMQEALEAPPPATVRAYASVFGRLPRGWPPVP
jgi:hypothetical protein